MIECRVVFIEEKAERKELGTFTFNGEPERLQVFNDNGDVYIISGIGWERKNKGPITPNSAQFVKTIYLQRSIK